MATILEAPKVAIVGSFGKILDKAKIPIPRHEIKNITSQSRLYQNGVRLCD